MRTVFVIFPNTRLRACQVVSRSSPGTGGNMRSQDGARDCALTLAIGVVDADAREAVNAAMRALGITVTIEADDVASLVTAVAAQPPLVVVVGSAIAGGGMRAVHQLSKEAPTAPVVFLSSTRSEDEMLDVLSAGAVGSLPRALPVSSIATAVL